MFLRHTLKDLPLEEVVFFAQRGERQAMDYLLRAYKPFIAKSVSQVCKRYIDQQDDEYSIGLFAFYDAIQSYSNRGVSFLTFASLVIRRRLIDFFRYHKKNPTPLPLDDYNDDEQLENSTEINVVNKQFALEQDHWNRIQEIKEYSAILAEYGLSLWEIKLVAPKHKDTRSSTVRIARILYKNKELRMFVRKRKQLPLKKLVTKVDVSKKTLERNRKYILAIFIVLDGNFLYLQDYIKNIR